MSDRGATGNENFSQEMPNGAIEQLPDLAALPDLSAILDPRPLPAERKPGQKQLTPKAAARKAREETARVMFTRAVVALDACIKRLEAKTRQGGVLTREENRALNQALYAVRNIVQWR